MKGQKATHAPPRRTLEEFGRTVGRRGVYAFTAMLVDEVSKREGVNLHLSQA